MQKPLQEIKYLMQNKASIFNVTPPNKKDNKEKELIEPKVDPFSQDWEFTEPVSKFNIDQV